MTDNDAEYFSAFSSPLLSETTLKGGKRSETFGAVILESGVTTSTEIFFPPSRRDADTRINNQVMKYPFQFCTSAQRRVASRRIKKTIKSYLVSRWHPASITILGGLKFPPSFGNN